MNLNNMRIRVPEEFMEGLTVLATLSSQSQPTVGMLIVGEDYEVNSLEITIRIYLVLLENTEWYIEDELQAFAFSNFESANTFVDDLPNMSALDLLLLMNGYQADSNIFTIFQ
jgi:hypothetical protein